METDPPKELPDLQQSVLDPETLKDLFNDLGALTKIIEIIPKTKETGYVDEQTSNLTLDDAYSMLMSAAVRGVQIRYQYQGSQWWDTLLPDAESNHFRIVRIQHDFD